MKKYLLAITLFATLVLWSGCTQEETNKDEYAFTGTVVDVASGEPKENVPVMVTNGTHIYTSAKTDANGMFKLYINIYKIDNQYYILIGDETTEQKRVEIRGFSSYETNLGTFEIQGQGKPVVEMGSCNVGKETIVCTASITNDGYLEIDEKGFCFGKTPRPSVDDIKVVCGSGKDNFIAEVSLSKFDKSSNYYVRPYAKNSKGIGYGKEVSFTTQEGLPIVETLNAENVKASSATIGGNLIENGGFKVYERGVCWDTDGTPDIDGNHKYISGDETGEYWIDVDGLKTNTKYFARAYAKNENGVSYGRIIEFTTVAGLPTVESLYAKNVEAKTASLGGQLISNGGYNVYERGVCWDTEGTPNIDDNHKYISGDETGEYWIDVNGLTPNKKYYACAYAKNENGISYGKLYDFTTTSSKVNVVIENPTDVTANSALLVATIKDAGSPAYTECGFCYSTQHEPTIYDNKQMVSFSSSGRYSKTVSGLEYNTVYYVRAYAIQSGEVIYSESEVNFKTVFSSAAVSLVEITDIEETTAILKGNVTNVGSPNYTERGFCWSNNSENPTIDMDYMRVSGTTKGTFKYEMNGLSKGTTYHVRAYVIQAGEVKYSNKMEFSTIRKPKVSTQNVTDIKSNGSWSVTYSATFNGYVDDAGSPAYEERGFVYSTDSSPTVGSGTKVTVSGSGKTGTFSASVSDIQSYKTYYVRAYVKTEKGYTYGETVTFTTY